MGQHRRPSDLGRSEAVGEGSPVWPEAEPPVRSAARGARQRPGTAAPEPAALAAGQPRLEEAREPQVAGRRSEVARPEREAARPEREVAGPEREAAGPEPRQPEADREPRLAPRALAPGVGAEAEAAALPRRGAARVRVWAAPVPAALPVSAQRSGWAPPSAPRARRQARAWAPAVAGAQSSTPLVRQEPVWARMPRGSWRGSRPSPQPPEPRRGARARAPAPGPGVAVPHGDRDQTTARQDCRAAAAPRPRATRRTTARRASRRSSGPAP